MPLIAAISSTQIPSTTLIKDFNEHDTDVDKVSPYHGVLTLSLQNKIGETQNGTGTRGPGRPPINDLGCEDVNDTEDPVNILLFIILVEIKVAIILFTDSFLVYSTVSRIVFNVLVRNLQSKQFVHTLVLN